MRRRQWPFDVNSKSWPILPFLLILYYCSINSCLAADAIGECFPISPDNIEFYCYSVTTRDTNLDKSALFCEDTHTSCSDWASRKECSRNPRFMLVHCPKSCDSCSSPHTKTVQILGKEQGYPTPTSEFLQAYYDTHEYIQERIVSHGQNLKTCVNEHVDCILRASQGDCSKDAALKTTCRAACRACL
jgi:hypothetical protein